MTAPIDPVFWRGRRVLVTGHTGFKGAWLSLWLGALGAEVTGLSDAVPTLPSLFELAGVERDAPGAAADVRDREAVRAVVASARPEVVLHLAAQPLVRRSYEQPAETWAVNVLGTAHVLDAVRDAGTVRSTVVVTSDKCYAPHDGERGHRESDPLGGDDPYSASKAATELLAAAYRRSYGLALATARAGNVIGGGDWGADRLIPDVMRAALAGEAVELRSPAAVRPWQHVLNPLAGYLLLAQGLWDDASLASGWNFGPADEEALPVRAVVERLGSLWGRELAVTDQAGEHPHENPALRLDSARAREALGWRPAWDLDAGLRATVDWYRAYARGDDVREVTLAQIAAFQADAAGRVEAARP